MFFVTHNLSCKNLFHFQSFVPYVLLATDGCAYETLVSAGTVRIRQPKRRCGAECLHNHLSPNFLYTMLAVVVISLNSRNWMEKLNKYNTKQCFHHN